MKGGTRQKDGDWSAREVAFLCPRQNGKGAVLEALILERVALNPGLLVLYSAHQVKTATEMLYRLRGRIEQTSQLKQHTRSIRVARGDETIIFDNGSRLKFVARSRGSTRGFSADMVILDEAYDLDDDAMAALLPTLSARPSAQIWYVSSAPHSTSTVLRRVCKRGRQAAESGEPGSLAYFEWAAADEADSGDVKAWLEANPGIGYRLTLEFTAQEQGAMADEDFRRERLGIWYEDEFQTVISMKRWRALHDPKIESPTGVLALAVDMTPDRSYVAIAAAIKMYDGRTHVEVTDHHGTTPCGEKTCWCNHSTVLGRVKELAEKHEACVVVIDAQGAAASMATALESELGEDRLLLTTARQMTRACGLFYDAVTDQTLHHLDQFELNDALRLATKRELGGAWAWSRKGSDADISPLVAATLASYGLSIKGDEKPKKKAFAVFA